MLLQAQAMYYDEDLKIQNLSSTTNLALTCHDSSSCVLHSIFQRVLLGSKGALLCKRMAGGGRKDPQRTLQIWNAPLLHARLPQASQHALGSHGVYQAATFR